MANCTFKYPDSTAPTSTITFDTKGHLVDGSDVTVWFNQKKGKSIGGTPYAESFGDNVVTHEFSFLLPITKVASESDQADMITFFGIIKGAVETFIYTDENGTELTVRCWNDTITFRTIQNAPKYRRCTLDLEVQ